MCDDAMTKAAADEMQRLYRALYAEYEEAKQRRVRHEEEAKKVQEQRNRLAAADKVCSAFRIVSIINLKK